MFHFFVAALLLAEPAVASALEQVRARGRLVVLCFPDPGSPFLHRDAGGATGGRLVDGFDGVDASILRAFASSLDVALEIREVSRFEDLIPALERGEGDLIAGGLSITEDRRRRVDFSKPYFPVAVVAIARKDSGLAALSALAGKRGTAAEGTTHAQLMREMGVTDVHPIARSGHAYEAVLKGAADFAFLDSTNALMQLDRYPELGIVGLLPVADAYGYGVALGSDLRAAIDAHLDGIRRQGLLYKFFLRHLGDRGAAMYELFEKTGSAPTAP